MTRSARTPLPFRMILVPIAFSVALAGCGWMNPMNWFGPSERVQTLEPKGGYAAALQDDRPLVPQVTDLRIDRTLTGAIVSATGLPPTQGWWNAALVAENDGLPVDGVITYRFVAAPPPAVSPDAHRALSPESRELTAAASINATRLAQTRRVVVIGAENSRAVTR
ncbi:hypothetical protein D2T29_17810 [Sinirhodobacter populi]|uniref:Uncharacterized protein n=1 Tax=Paenirhodobacter populi TaxID=2306993 RepID=A0A443K549_9RHOB|nr:hypothetical protein [Sinirhodobacter populi]RWR07870.1 hypothetical protein D2T33_16305 [Sinirhodobacter populi]RWR26857.1 hypothetical protein D2T31_18670 [Sinirhodobacter populi]RWR27845.1 hypothetical protein D2T29_17810 [Sinirhodobacter populi]